MKKIAILVVTYNRKELLLENINALLHQTLKGSTIFIIDNNSTDGTKEMIKALDIPEIQYFNTGSNLGGAGGFSFGLNEVLKRDFDYCWIMDDDTIPEPEALKSLCDKADLLHDDFSFISSIVKWTDGKLCKMNIPGWKRSRLNGFEGMENHLLRIATSSFVSLFVNLKIAHEIGLPIKEFFIYGDDCEYTLRLSKIKPGYWDLDSIVLHKMRANQGINIATEGEDRLERHYYNIRNLTYIAKKYGWDGIPTCIINVFGGVINVLLHAETKKMKRIGIIIKGFFSGIFFNPKIVREYQ